VTYGPQLLLIGAVGAVGVLHTMVPDHWVPIALIARQRGWSKAQTARASLLAGTGHVLSTLAIALVVWLAGVAAAERFGHMVDTISSLALIAFGGWIATSAWWEMRRNAGHGHAHSHSHQHGHSHAHDALFTEHSNAQHGHEHDGHTHAHGEYDHDRRRHHEYALTASNDPLYAPLRGERVNLTRHIHIHRHGRAALHAHWHDHAPGTDHLISAEIDTAPPLHHHRHKTTARTALLLILGSSPMVEGIPAFFAAGRYGAGLIVVMAIVFALATMATYVTLCVYSTAGLQRMEFGAFERYGEVLSGALIALAGFAFWVWPLM